MTEWTGHEESAVRCDWSSDGARVATTGNDGRVRLWSHAGADAGTLLALDPPTQVTSVAFSPDATLVAAPAAGGTARAWRCEDGAWDVAWSPDGSALAVAALDSTIRILRAPAR